MKLMIQAIEASHSDTTGQFALVNVKTLDGPKRLLQMQLATAGKLIQALCNATKQAHQARGGDESSVTTFDVALRPDAAGIGIRSDAGADVVLRFGLMSLVISIDAESIQPMAAALSAAAETPTTKQ